MRDPALQTTGAAVRLAYPRVYASPNGETHFQEVDLPLTPVIYVPDIPLVDVGEPQTVTALTFSRVEAGYTSDWHPAKTRQFVLIVAGVMELTVSDGETRQFGPGSIFLVVDTPGTGKGHQTRAVGSEDCVFVTVTLA
jgi:quercetin dioxygenase-like cupin family protein